MSNNNPHELSIGYPPRLIAWCDGLEDEEGPIVSVGPLRSVADIDRVMEYLRDEARPWMKAIEERR